MSTVDIDTALKDILLGFVAKSAIMGDHFVYDADNLNAAKAAIKSTLKAELLANMPKQKDAFGEQMHPGKHDFDNQLKYGYNQALAEVTKLIEEL